jgi:hypothetical protein
MKEELDKLQNLSIKLGKFRAAHNAVGFDVFISPYETLRERIAFLETEINKLKEVILDK